MEKILEIFILITILSGFSAFPQSNNKIDEMGHSKFIVGGRNATITDYPFLASLRTWDNFHFCGGSILNSRWILSAAHCTYRSSDNGVWIVVGTSHLYTGGTSYRSSKVINHPSYNDELSLFDICLVQVSTAIIFGPNVGTINLPTSRIESIPVIIAGWGATVQNGPSSIVLQEIQKTTITDQECFNIIGPNTWVNEFKICTLPAIPGTGVCGGDSGGPVFNGRSLVGIVSWGFVPCGGGLPDIHERVFPFRDWILNNMK